MSAASTKEISFTKLTSDNIKKLELVDFSNEMMKYITGSSLSFQQAKQRYSVNINHAIFGSYFVEYSDDDQIIGFAVIKDQGIEAEIGYLVMEPFRGQGVATHINKQLIDICQKNLPDRKISAQADIRNLASIKVLEKSGMRRMTTIENEGSTICKFGISP